jgi:hypothetical protein
MVELKEPGAAAAAMTTQLTMQDSDNDLKDGYNFPKKLSKTVANVSGHCTASSAIKPV